jgi:DoxX-like family
VLLPMTPARLKEWAYAGLIFDVVSALYSAIAVGDAPNQWIPPIIALTLIGGSYILYRQREQVEQQLVISNKTLI